MTKNRFFETGKGLKFQRTPYEVSSEDKILTIASIEAKRRKKPISSVLKELEHAGK